MMWFILILLSAFSWSLVNVFNSIIVHNYIKSPVALTWIQSCISAPLLLIIWLKFDVSTSWYPYLFLFGVTAYFADLWFFNVVHHTDISVTNGAWSILALLLSAAGFLFFHENWSLYQSIGAALIISGTFLMSFYHEKTNLMHTLYLLFVMAILYLPYYLVKKAAIADGSEALATFFWLILGREFLSVLVPMRSIANIKKTTSSLKLGWPFFIICIFTVILYFAAEYLGALAYVSGPISLVAVTGNVQPFFVMGLAWFAVFLHPKRSPKELLTHQSVKIKLISFIIVFGGLALIGGSV